MKKPKEIFQKSGNQKIEATEKARKTAVYTEPSRSMLFNDFFSKFKNKRTAWVVTSWDESIYFTMLPIALCIARTGYGASWSDENARGYNATPDSMTRMDLKILKSYRVLCNKEKKDEWVNAQEAAKIDHLIGDILLIGTLAEQIFYHKIIPSSKEDEALAANEIKWDEDYLNNAINRVTRSEYQIDEFSINFLKTFMVYWRYDSIYDKKALPGGYFVPNQLFRGITFAMWTELWNTLKGTLPSAQLHSVRTSMPMRKVSEKDFDIYKEIDPNSERAFFFKWTGMVRGKDGGGNQITLVEHPNSDKALGGTAIDWDNLFLPAFAPESAPSDIWALLSVWADYNDNANNIYQLRAIPPAPTSNSKFSLISTGYNSVAAPSTEYTGTSIVNLLPNFPSFEDGQTWTFSNGGAAVTDSFYEKHILMKYFAKDTHYISAPFSTASGIWDDVVESVYSALFKSVIS